MRIALTLLEVRSTGPSPEPGVESRCQWWVLASAPMELTAGQRRTLDRLIGRGERPGVPPGVPERVRTRLEEGLSDLEVTEPLWLSKRRLEELAQCEGLLQASLAGEGERFAYGAQSAAGTLMHRAIQLDVAAERGVDVRTVVDRAADRIVEHDGAFAPYWASLDELDRAERLAEAAAALAMFREMFPPIPRGWQPVSEQSLRVRLAGGMVVLSGRLDLVLGRRSPYRVATVFLQSMEWQAEDVTEETLDLAADRVVGAAGSAAALAAGREPELRPGPHCRWCPRSAGCPALAAARAGAKAG